MASNAEISAVSDPDGPPPAAPVTRRGGGAGLLFLAIGAGAVIGIDCNHYLPAHQLEAAKTLFDLLNQTFLRLVKMIIAPLVLTSLIGGIGGSATRNGVGASAWRALAIFLVGSICALALGALAAIAFQPGVGLHLTGQSGAVVGAPIDMTPAGFLARLVPTSIVDALATNSVLQIVVFSIFAGVALRSLGDRAAGLLQLAQQGADLMSAVAQSVMRFAPVGAFAAMAGAFATHGLGLIGAYGVFVAEFYGLLLVILGLLAAFALLTLGPRVFDLMRLVRQPAALAFSTGSAEVAYPKLLLALEAFGVPRSVASFVLPLGYAFNLVGSMAYCAFAVLFVVQAFDVQLDATSLVLMLFMLLIMSKGIANVPRASLVVIAAVLPYFKIPEAAVALLLAVDQVLDMGRTGVNTIANAITVAVVAKWETPPDTNPKPEPA
jgi:Na+/H+-dicarboxylate symporter